MFKEQPQTLVENHVILQKWKLNAENSCSSQGVSSTQNKGQWVNRDGDGVQTAPTSPPPSPALGGMTPVLKNGH